MTRAKVRSYVCTTLPPYNDNMKSGSPTRAREKEKKSSNKQKSHVATAIIKMRQEKRGHNKILTLKVCSETPWAGGVLISFESFLKNKEALQETVVVENLKVPRSVRSTVLDEDVFSVQLQKVPEDSKANFYSNHCIRIRQCTFVRHSLPNGPDRINCFGENLSEVSLTSTGKSKVKDH